MITTRSLVFAVDGVAAGAFAAVPDGDLPEGLYKLPAVSVVLPADEVVPEGAAATGSFSFVAPLSFFSTKTGVYFLRPDALLGILLFEAAGDVEADVGAF